MMSGERMQVDWDEDALFMADLAYLDEEGPAHRRVKAAMVAYSWVVESKHLEPNLPTLDQWREYRNKIIL